MKYFLAFLLSLSLGAAFAQPEEMDEKRKEKIERLKRMFISEKLDLSTSEAEKFWPIYNDYDKKKEAVRKSIHQANKKLKTGGGGEKEAIETIDQVTQKRKEEADLDARFLKDCLPVLGVEKVMKLATLEREFQKELVQKIKERRQGAPGGGPGGGPGMRRQ